MCVTWAHNYKVQILCKFFYSDAILCIRQRQAGFLCVVFLTHSTVTMAVSVAVCEIFSVKEWCELENRVRVRSRSLEMAPFDRSHTSSYLYSIVTMAISCIVCEI